MQIIFVLWLLIRFSKTASNSMQTYSVAEYCDSSITMVMSNTSTARLLLRETYVEECTVAIETDNKLMFFFEYFDFDSGDNSTCQETYMEVFDGLRGTSPSYISGLDFRLCGTVKPDGIFSGSGKYITFYVKNNRLYKNEMSVLVTPYRTGSCHTGEIECSKNRCVADDAITAVFNSCDDKAYLFGYGTIVALIIAACTALFSFFVLIFVLRQCCKKTTVIEKNPLASPCKSSESAVLMKTFPKYDPYFNYQQCPPPPYEREPVKEKCRNVIR